MRRQREGYRRDSGSTVNNRWRGVSHVWWSASPPGARLCADSRLALGSDRACSIVVGGPGTWL